MITLQNLIPDFSKKLLLKAAAAASVLFLSVTLSAIPSFAASAYDNLAVANVTSEPLNMRTKPSTDGEIVGKCYRGAGGTVLEKKDGWTKVRSGKIEGWMSDKYLLFGADIEPLAKELGLLSAKITATTLNVRETPTTDSAILKQAAEGDSFPVLSESDGWAKVQLSADTNGYISSQYASIGPVPAAAVDAKEESAALSASGNGTSTAPSYVISATEDEIYLMAACVAMETGDDRYEDQLAVASCIVNRVKSKKWGKTISDVIYADGQFPGATSGLLDKYLAKGPSKSCIKAPKDALAGSNNIGDYLFFKAAKHASTGSYSSYKIVGGNCFYKK